MKGIDTMKIENVNDINTLVTAGRAARDKTLAAKWPTRHASPCFSWKKWLEQFELSDADMGAVLASVYVIRK